jgi:hypothetical protein
MIQPSRELRLADEAITGERLHDLVAQDLDGDIAVMPKIARKIDCGHAAAAKLTFNVVLTREHGSEVVVHRGKGHA